MFSSLVLHALVLILCTAVSSDASIDFIDPELNSFARTKIWQAFLLGMISFGGD